MRMIDADALEAFVKTVRQGLYLDKTLSDIPTRDSMLLNFQQYVHLQPTISAVPVVRGEWVKSDNYKGWLVCSACHDCYVDNAWVNGKKWRYCPNCGALMEDKS
jgi:hypothetical protein